MEDGCTERDAMVDTFMEVTSCGSLSLAVRHLDYSGWLLEAAINRYFIADGADPPPVHPVDPIVSVRSETVHDGGDDRVRDPIPARADTLYQYQHDDDFYRDFYGASSAAAPSSIWSVNRDAPSRLPVYPVPVAAGLGSGGSEDDTDKDEKEEAHISCLDERANKAEQGHGRNRDKETMEEEYYDCNGSDGEYEDDDQDYGYDGSDGEYVEEDDDDDQDYGYDGSDGEYVEDDDDDDQDYLNAAEADRTEAQSPPRARADDKTLDDLFRPPYELMFLGSFHEAKVHAAREDKWLLVNLQSSGVFASHLHNRDLWSNEVVAQVVRDSFVFSLLQKTGRPGGDEAGKVCCFYKLDDGQLPAVLVLDPITGQLLAKWCGVVQQPDDFLTSIGRFTESKPSTVSKPKIVRPIATTTPQEPAPAPAPAPLPKADKTEATPAPLAPPVTMDDGKPMEGEAVCKLRIRSPTGNTVTKEFGGTRTVSMLFAYCRSVVDGQAFRIMRLVGRGFKELVDDGASFEDVDLNRDTVTVVFDV